MKRWFVTLLCACVSAACPPRVVGGEDPDAGTPPAMVPFSFQASGTWTDDGVNPQPVTLVGRVEVGGDGQPVSAVLSLGPEGAAVEATGIRQGDRLRFTQVALARDFVPVVDGSQFLEDTFTLAELDLLPAFSSSGLTTIQVNATGTFRVWDTTDVFDEGACALTLQGGPDTTAPQASVFEFTGGAVAPLSPLRFVFGEPVTRGSLELSSLSVTTGPDPVALEEVTFPGESGTFVHHVQVLPARVWPLGSTLIVSTGTPTLDLAGLAWAPLSVPGPPAPGGWLESTSFEDGATQGFTALTPPTLVEAPDPYAAGGGHVLVATAPGAWGTTRVPAAGGLLRVVVSYQVVPTGVGPNDNPEWVLRVFGFSVQVVSLVSNGRVEVNRDLTDRTMTLLSSGVYTLPPETIELDLGAVAGEEVLVQLTPRDFIRSPATGLGRLLVDSVEVP